MGRESFEELSRVVRWHALTYRGRPYMYVFLPMELAEQKTSKIIS
jgi:hypothetical protein